jgi:hypothetical protein
MNGLFRKLAKAAMLAAVFCFVAGGAFAKDPERPYRGRGHATVVGACELNGVVGQLFEGTGNQTHGGLFGNLTCVIVTGGVLPVLTIAGEGVSTVANGNQYSYVLQGTVDVQEDPCVAEYTLTVLGGTSRKGVPLDITGEIQGTNIQPWSAPNVCGPELDFELIGTITY